MGRSVNYLNDSIYETYFDVTYMTEDWEWDDFKEYLQERLQRMFPSLERVENKWDGREVRIILENSFCEIGISKYCSLASLSIRVHPDVYDYHPGMENLSLYWIAKRYRKFTSLGNFYKVGTFSNGEGVYEQIKKE